MLEGGHQRANFAIVATAANAASPHHDPSERVIVDGDVVLCDFGGTMDGYCSDITRMFVVGEPDAEVRDAYAVLVEAQEAGVRAATVGHAVRGRRRRRPTGDHRRRLRRLLHAPHRSRHRHRGPRGSVRGRRQHDAARARPRVQRRAGHLPPGRFGLRLEDIVVATDAGPERLNHAATRPRGRRAESCSSIWRRSSLQWAAGGLLFCWVTTRRREVGIGYGWLLRISFGLMAVLAVDRRRRLTRGTGAMIRNVRHRGHGVGGRHRAAPVATSAAMPACAGNARCGRSAPHASPR